MAMRRVGVREMLREMFVCGKKVHEGRGRVVVVVVVLVRECHETPAAADTTRLVWPDDALAIDRSEIAEYRQWPPSLIAIAKNKRWKDRIG